MLCYVHDDVVIATPTLRDLSERLDVDFDFTERACLNCIPSKCEILRDSIKNLGRKVDTYDLRHYPNAVEAVLT